MTAKQLNTKFNRAPVLVELTSGTQIYVPHREFVAVGPIDGDPITCYDESGNIHTIEVSNITDIIKIKADKPKPDDAKK